MENKSVLPCIVHQNCRQRFHKEEDLQKKMCLLLALFQMHLELSNSTTLQLKLTRI